MRTSDQLRRCARAVAKKGAKAGHRLPSRADVSRAFAICTSSLQRSGYLVPGTNAPTLAGLLRAAEMDAEADHARKMDEYEEMLARIRGHRRAREVFTALRGAANRSSAQEPTVPQLQDLRGAPRAPRTPAEAKAQVQPLRHALEEVFSCETSFGDCHPDHPSAGHCFLASMMAQDVLGGEIVTGEVKNIPHYWVRVPLANARGGKSGKTIDVDVTGDQFDRAAVQAKVGALYPNGKTFDREPGEYLGQAGNRKVMQLYCKLRKKVIPVLKEQGQAALAARIAATR